jgi:hypothetical protein
MQQEGIPLYCQRKILSAITNVTVPQTASSSTCGVYEKIEAPSIITARSASMSAVSGNALMKG